MCISSIDCLFDCSKVGVDGNYTDLSVYTNGWSESGYDYRLFNRTSGQEWKFTVSFDDSKDGIVHIEESVDSNKLVNGIEKHLFVRSNDSLEDLNAGCDLMAQDIEPDIRCHIEVWYRPSSPSRNKIIKCNKTFNQSLNFSHNSVFLRPIPGLNKYLDASYLLVVDKDNRTERMKILFTSECELQFEICQPINFAQCPAMQFIEGFPPFMSDQLFSRIDSVVEYRNGSIYGHLLFFTINNRPFYCLQPESQPLSQQV